MRDPDAEYDASHGVVRPAITPNYSTTTSNNGYSALSQSDLYQQVQNLKDLQSQGFSFRVGEELSMAKLYLDSNYKPEETKTENPLQGGANLVVAAIPPTPPPPATIVVLPPPIKTATPQYILPGEDVMAPEIMVDLIFENISGQELLSLSRHDLINGDNISNQLISNISKINQIYDSKNLLPMALTSNKYFGNFAIKLNNKIPLVGNGENGSNIYVDSDNSIIIEFVNLANDEQVELQVATNGTIYKVGN